MKNPSPQGAGRALALLGIALLSLFSQPLPSANAASLNWDTDGNASATLGGTGVWDVTSLFWNNGGVMQAWDNGANDTAMFAGNAGTVTLGADINVAGLAFNTSGYTLIGNGHTLTLGGTIIVTNAGHTALIQSAITLKAVSAFNGAGELTLGENSTIDASGFALSKSGTGTLNLAGSIVNSPNLTINQGTVNLSGSYTQTTYTNATGLTVTGGSVFNVTGQLGTSAALPLGQTGFSGNSVTNFSGTAFLSGTSSTFRVGEGSNATVNVIGGTLTIGTTSAGLIVGRSNAAASGFLNVSGGSLQVVGSTTLIRVGAGYSNAESSGPSVITISDTGLFDTNNTTGTILLGSNLAGNTTSSGTLNLNGGTLATGRSITGGSVGASILNFNGGILKANATSSPTATSLTLAESLTTVNVRDGGALIDTNGLNFAIPKNLSHSNIEGDAAIDGGLTKLGEGTLTLSGAMANTYTGMTRVNAGALYLSKTTWIDAIAGDVTISGNALLHLVNSHQIADTSIIHFTESGTFRLNSKVETIGGLSSEDGAGIVENEHAAGGVLTLNNTGTQNFSGILQNGTLTGTLALIKTGTGTQILSGNNTYTGSTTLNEGTLRFGIDNALHPTTTVILSGASDTGIATLDIDNHTWSPSSVITFYNANSTATSQGIIQMGATGQLKLNNSVTLAATGHSLGAFIQGGTIDLNGTTRSFIIADSLNAIADLTISSNIISSSGTTAGISKSGAGTLRLSGEVTIPGGFSIDGGVLEITGTTNNGTSNTSITGTATPPMLRIVQGGDFSTNILIIGTLTGQVGSTVLQGGQLNITTAGLQEGIRLGGAGYGGLFISGGSLYTNRIDSMDGTPATAVAMLQVSGGTVNTAKYIMFRNQRWEFTMTGGQVLRTGEHIALSFRGSATAKGVMTMAGGLIDNTSFSVTIGQQNDATALADADLNLNAGTLITRNILHYNNTGADAVARINFNGGLLRAALGASAAEIDFISIIGTGGTGSITGYVNGAFGTFEGGARIDSNGYSIRLPTPLLAPVGNGVTSIPLITGGSGYIGAPYVEISGGGGVGATASAVVDLDPTSPTYGQLLDIVITNPGEGYTSEPTITLIGGGGTGVSLGAITTAPNTSGGLHKSGAGTLIISGTEANTFTGASTVTAGELHLGKPDSVTAVGGDIALGNGTSSVTVKLLNNEQIGDTGVLTFNGTGANASIFRLNNFSETIGGLSSTNGAGIVENESGATGLSLLTLQVASGVQSFSGVIRDGNGSGIDGTLTLIKTGEGTQILSGANLFSGATLVSEGVLQISSGGSTGIGPVIIEYGTLVGSGTVRGSSFNAYAGAIIQAGDGTSPTDFGTLHFAPSGPGEIDFYADSTIILGLNPGGVSDSLNFVGMGSNTLLLEANLTITTANPFIPTNEETFQLFDWSGLAYDPVFAGHYYSNGGLLYGNGDEAFGLDLPDIFGSGYAWDISQLTSSGSIAVVFVVPEPSRLLLLGSALCLLTLRRRRAC